MKKIEITSVKKAAKALGCKEERVKLVSTRRPVKGIFWVELNSQNKVKKFLPVFKEVIAPAHLERMKTIESGSYFLFDGGFYVYDAEKKTVSRVKTIKDHKMVVKRTLLEGEAFESATICGVKLPNTPDKEIFVWLVRTMNRDRGGTKIYRQELLLAVFADDEKKLVNIQREKKRWVRHLHQGNYIHKNGKNFLVMSDHQGFYLMETK